MMPGAPVAEAVFASLLPRIESLHSSGYTPGLGTILVGDDGASTGYIRMKQAKAAELGCASPHIHLKDNATQADLLAAIRDFNTDPRVDAMLMQHPTPPQIDFDDALLTIDPAKDVDGLHPEMLADSRWECRARSRAPPRVSKRSSPTTKSRFRVVRS